MVWVLGYYLYVIIILGVELDSFDKSLELIKKVEEFSQLNKDLKDRNDELEIKKCQKCQMLPSVDLEEENLTNSELDNEHAKLYFLCKVIHLISFFCFLVSVFNIM